jgi:DNA-binding beta-propeller fold protein YncE
VRGALPADADELPSYESVTSETTERRKQAALFGKNRLRRMPFLLFVSWWAIFNFIAYTLAGEKMPWLATHITTPMIFLAAWYFGRVADGVDWAAFRQRTWVYLLLLPVIAAAVLQLLSPFILGQQPFAGLAQGQLQNTMQWIALLLVVGIVGWLVVRVASNTGWMQLRRLIGVVAFAGLAVITFRAAWVASFINYDYANEFLVYAHGAPGVKTMVEQIEEISRRTTDGMNIRFAWGGNAWPVTWYFRDLTNAEYFRENPTLQQVENAAAIYVSADVRSRLEPLLEDRFQSFEYMRMWWPDQEYFNLTPERVLNALDLSGENPQSAQIRRGIWDIWWARDYSAYGEATGRDYSFTNWPVSERLYFYVRKDIAAQVWDLGAGVAGAGGAVVQVAETSVCTSNWQALSANRVFDSASGIVLDDPVGVVVSDDGTIYIADQTNNRIVALNQAGEQIATYGDDPNALVVLTRPNGIDIGVDGNLYIADTWSYRVQVISPQSNVLAAWGQQGLFGIEAPAEPLDGFWAPRDIATDLSGRVYVADTGNKRVRVYTATGEHVRDIGFGGSQPGQLDEPVGLDVSPDGRLFVADTWNRRVSVFSTEDGTLLYTFPVLAWYEDLGNRPYLAVDPVRNLLYVADPDAARVIVYDTFGNCVGSFGQKGNLDDLLDAATFVTIGGIDVEANGQVYVTDLAANRVLRFDPFPALPPVEGEIMPDVLPESTEESAALGGEIIIEMTPEVTAEAGP